MSGLKPGVVIVKSMWYLMGISTLMAHGYALGAEDFYENKTILDQIDDHTQKFVFRADNCFTWARRKLEMLDIHLESNRWKEMIIAFPGIGVSTQRIDETDHDASSHSLDPEDNEVMTHNLSTITIEEIPDDEEVTQSGGSIIEEWKVSDETD